jgi:transcriptional regulator with XRE-family HTH domain
MNKDLATLKKSSIYAEEAFVVDVQSFLQGLLEEKGLTRTQLAAEMGVSKARVSQMFSSSCKNFTIRLLARALFALGETAELTCDGHRRIRRQAMFDELLFVPERSDWAAARWELSFGAVNDDQPSCTLGDGIEIAATGDAEEKRGLVANALRGLSARAQAA